MYGCGYISQHSEGNQVHLGNLWFIVMELMDGSFAQIIHKDTAPLHFKEKIEIALQVCSGLWYLHKHKVIHRDIKPGNILVCIFLFIYLRSYWIYNKETTSS